MKTLLLVLLGSLAMTTGSYAQTITKVDVVFKVTDDDKDFDTNVEILYKTVNGILVAYRYDDLGGTFHDNTNYNVSTDLKNANIPVASIPNSEITITMFPNGNDDWHFHFDLKISLSNGNVLVYAFTGIQIHAKNQRFVGTLRN